MRRTRKVKTIQKDSFREKVIRNVLSYHRHFEEWIEFMDIDWLLAHTHPAFREDINRGKR